MTILATKRALVGLALALALTVAPRAEAAVINVDATNPVDIPGLTGFMTTGAMMSGMSVTAVFDTFSQTLFWATTGPVSGGVSGAGWSLTATGDTFDINAWSFVNDGAGLLTGLILNGAPGLTVFDKQLPDPGTTGSASGRDFATNLAGDGNIVATYRNPLGVGGADPVGDLFHIVDVDFSGLSDGGVRTGFLFTQDTDNDARFLQVPEPGLIALLGLGLLGVANARRRRARD